MSDEEWQAAEWMSISVCARTVGMTNSRIRRMIMNKQVRVLAIVGRPMVSCSDVRKYMNRILVEAQPSA